MVEIQIRYEGELHTVARHGPSQATLATDAPVDNHGRGESFSPTDLVATALGACMVTLMGITAERHGWSLEGTEVRVVKHMVQEPVRRIGKLEVEIRVAGRHDPAARRALERAALTCPVQRSLHPEVELPVRFVWNED